MEGMKVSTSKDEDTGTSTNNLMIVAVAETSGQGWGAVLEMKIDECRGATWRPYTEDNSFYIFYMAILLLFSDGKRYILWFQTSLKF